MPTPPTPSDEELDILIHARLALAGVDLDQADPVTGTPSRAAALASLRSFVAGPLINGQRVGGTPRVVGAWRPPVSEGPDADRLAQQVTPPALYPSILTAWTKRRR